MSASSAVPDSNEDPLAKAVWARTVAKLDHAFGLADAKRRYDDLGQMSIGSADFWVESDHSISLNGPATFSLSMLLDGRITSCLDGGSPLVIEPGSAVVFASQTSVSGTNWLSGQQRIRLVDIRFTTTLLEEAGGVPLSRFARELFVDRSVPESGTIFIAFPAHARLLSAAAQMMDSRFDDERVRRLFLQAKALEALALTISILGGNGLDRCRLAATDQDKLARARELLHNRFEEDWTIPVLARTVGLSERKLKAGFRSAVGHSVHAYLKDIRLSAAASMLTEGRSVTDVALSVGFDNLSHFSKIFREFHGTNPSSYARQSRR